MNQIPRYVYHPSRAAPPVVSPEIMSEVHRLYLQPSTTQIREVRPVDQTTAEGLEQVRLFRGRRT